MPSLGEKLLRMQVIVKSLLTRSGKNQSGRFEFATSRIASCASRISWAEGRKGRAIASKAVR
jgi:hypothetical protein